MSYELILKQDMHSQNILKFVNFIYKINMK